MASFDGLKLDKLIIRVLEPGGLDDPELVRPANSERDELGRPSADVSELLIEDRVEEIMLDGDMIDVALCWDEVAYVGEPELCDWLVADKEGAIEEPVLGNVFEAGSDSVDDSPVDVGRLTEYVGTELRGKLGGAWDVDSNRPVFDEVKLADEDKMEVAEISSIELELCVMERGTDIDTAGVILEYESVELNDTEDKN